MYRLTKYSVLSFLLIAIVFNSCVSTKSPLINNNGNEHPDSLYKYSYWISGIKQVLDNQLDTTRVLIESVGGTCFFIRHNGSIYLITAQHVLIGCLDSLPIKDKTYPDFMNLWVGESEYTKAFHIQIDVRTIKDTSNCRQLYEAPDVFVIKMPDMPELANIFSVEKYLRNDIHSVTDIVFHGYPLSSGANVFNKPPPSNIRLPAKSYKLSDGMYYSESKITDSINYIIYPNNLDFGDLHGYSGSPAFFKDHKTGGWVLFGLLCAGKNRLIVCKIENALKHIY
jgi:hypothetical protein